MFHLDRQQLEALFQVARAQSERDWLMILVVYNHGLRATEVVTLTPANLRDGFLTVKRLKGSRCTLRDCSTATGMH